MSDNHRNLAIARNKINKINRDILNSVGLTQDEIKVAVEAGLIDEDQAYFWTEEWQKGMRESERDIREGRVTGFDNADDFFRHLDKL